MVANQVRQLLLSDWIKLSSVTQGVVTVGYSQWTLLSDLKNGEYSHKGDTGEKILENMEGDSTRTQTELSSQVLNERSFTLLWRLFNDRRSYGVRRDFSC